MLLFIALCTVYCLYVIQSLWPKKSMKKTLPLSNFYTFFQLVTVADNIRTSESFIEIAIECIGQWKSFLHRIALAFQHMPMTKCSRQMPLLDHIHTLFFICKKNMNRNMGNNGRKQNTMTLSFCVIRNSRQLHQNMNQIFPNAKILVPSKLHSSLKINNGKANQSTSRGNGDIK